MTNEEIKSQVDTYLEALVATLPDDIVNRAAAYSLKVGGKRVRPMLVFEAMKACGGDANWLPAAAAIELVHTYSLVHDDLPAMDDDDLRRGHATVHVKYDEATAILVGDGLQTLAFQHLAQAPYSAEQKLACILALSKASGLSGMVLGQSMDMVAENEGTDLAGLKTVHQLKTGALIEAALACGAIIANASPEQVDALARYGRAVGLAFQVADDLLDVEGDSTTIGKPQGSDIENGKTTYVSLLGIAGAKEQAQQLCNEAIAALQCFGETADPLRSLAKYIVERKQ
ncbi:polyprenyl synthetase family protein [Salinibius halmophilus]|uniref:polyprenyl synthetase family protein n=1 Tax=Salinibius halmophilus TaxID=1853216 RepID=UPI000E6643D3|nr:farnesyl diphosphate synthase [Salinibius halmophilus]